MSPATPTGHPTPRRRSPTPSDATLALYGSRSLRARRTACLVDPECVTATREAAELLESLGHKVQEIEIEADPAYVDNFINVWIGAIEDELNTWSRISGQQIDPDRLEPLSRQMYDISKALTATAYLGSLDWLHRYSRGLAAVWSEIDVLVTPTLALRPVEIGALRPKEGEQPLQMLLNAGAFVPFTPVWNVTGQPAVSLPLHQSKDGLPVGVQFVGPPAGEELLISLSAQLEEARPWADRRPALALA